MSINQTSAPTTISAATTACPVCGTSTSRSIAADIAIFLRVSCPIHPDVQGRSYFCDACEHVYFTPFLTPEQLGSLYAGYRGPLYNQLRLAVEPTYLPYIAAFADQNSDHDNARRAYYDTIFPKINPMRVVDFGGGDGRFSKYLFPKAEITIVEEDFERNGGDLDATIGQADLFFCAHVAEHLPQPFTSFKPLIDRMKLGAFAWIEVPQEYPDSVKETFERLEAGSSEISALRIMHEHIAHYSQKSLQTLAQRLGLQVVQLSATNMIQSAFCRKPAC